MKTTWIDIEGGLQLFDEDTGEIYACVIEKQRYVHEVTMHLPTWSAAGAVHESNPYTMPRVANLYATSRQAIKAVNAYVEWCKTTARVI